MMSWLAFFPRLRILGFGLMVPRLMVMLLLLVKDLLVFSRSSIVSGLLPGWVSLMDGLGLGYLILSPVLVVVVGEAR